jgi:phage baseplate assembly protein W
VPTDGRTFLGTGWSFPIAVGPGGGLGWSAGEQKVAESIWLILSTALGERAMRPLVGCGVHDLLFAGDTATTRAAIAEDVREALTTWEVRIDVLDVQVEAADEIGASLVVFVDYRVRANNAKANLVYPLYAVEGLSAAGSAQP